MKNVTITAAVDAAERFRTRVISRAVAFNTLIALIVLYGCLLLFAKYSGRFTFDVIPCVTAVCLFALALWNARLLNGIRDERERSRKTLEGLSQDLVRARDEALAIAKSKSAFLASMSHEIRTPMNAVVGCTDMLKRTRLDSDQQRLVEIILNSGAALIEIINDILVLSKLEAGKLDLKPEPTGVLHFVESTADLLADKAAAKGLALSTMVMPDANVDGLVDAQRLRQILINLLSNAVKFTDAGSISISAHITKKQGDKFWISFAVRDTGIGIPENQRSLLFEPFVQCDTTHNHRGAGTGLGLAISKRIAELLGGHIDLESECGKGSTFTVTVPMNLMPDNAGQASPVVPLVGLHILVVGTSVEEFAVLRSYGQMCQTIMDYAADSDSALRCLHYAATADSGAPYDGVICNDSFPGGGVEWFVKQVHTIDLDAKVILLAPFAGLTDAFEKSLAGLCYCLNRPLHQSALFECLNSLFKPSAQARSFVPAAEVVDDFSKALPLESCRRILVVEDNRINQEVAKLQLTELGFEPVLVSSGFDAIELIQNDRFVLVLMDCNMPGIDGLETTRRIRALANRSAAGIPIVAMTANAMEGDREHCLAAGMNDYITKPVLTAPLKEIVEKWSLVASAEDEPAVSFSPDSQSSPGGKSIAELAGENQAATLLRQLELIYGPADGSRFIQMFVQQVPSLLERLKQAVDDGASERVYQAAHELKGACLMMYVHDMASMCAAIENYTRELEFGKISDLQLSIEVAFDDWKRSITMLKSSDEHKDGTNSAMTKIVLVEDNELTRVGLRTILNRTKNFQVIGEFNGGKAVMQQVMQLGADVVLIDIGLPEVSGIEVTRQLKAQNPNIKTLIVTAHDDEHDMFESFAAGADGYILKQAFDQRVLEMAIQSVMIGNCWLDPKIAARVLEFAKRQKKLTPLTAFDPIEPLTVHEESVLQIAGCSDGVCSVEPAFIERLHRFARSNN